MNTAPRSQSGDLVSGAEGATVFPPGGLQKLRLHSWIMGSHMAEEQNQSGRVPGWIDGKRARSGGPQKRCDPTSTRASREHLCNNWRRTKWVGPRERGRDLRVSSAGGRRSRNYIPAERRPPFDEVPSKHYTRNAPRDQSSGRRFRRQEKRPRPGLLRGLEIPRPSSTDPTGPGR